MTGTFDFKPFSVTIPEGRRFWEDDSTGVSIKQGQKVQIGQRQFRSAELRFALLRSQVLILDGQAEFAFRDKIVRVTPGDKKNIIVTLGEETEKVIKNEIKNDDKKIIPEKKAEEIKKTIKRDIDDIEPLEEDYDGEEE